jgi:hypothetical protein
MTLTHEDILNYCNYLINKDQVSDPVSPVEYNSIIPVVNIEVFHREKRRITELSISKQMNFIELLRDSYLNELKKVINGEAVSPIKLEDDYDMMLSSRIVIGGIGRKVNIVPETKFNELANGLVDNVDSVYGYLVNKYVYLSANGTEFTYHYLALPARPYYDYYIDSGHNQKYLKPGWTVKQGQGEYYIVDSSNVTVVRQITYPFIPDYQSKSVEFSYGDSAYTEIVNLVFEKMGVEIRERLPIDFAQMKKSEG